MSMQTLRPAYFCNTYVPGAGHSGGQSGAPMAGGSSGRPEWACNQANPLDLLQIRDDDGQPGFALFPDGFDNMELAMDGLKDVKPLNGCEGKKRCGVAVDFHSAVSRS